jgi:hypothetical protein
MEKHVVRPENASQIWDWLQARGGLFVWRSADLSDPSASVTTPARNADGSVKTSPGWKYPGSPERHVTSADDVIVIQSTVLEEVPVSLKRGSGFMNLVLTDGSERKMERKTEKHRKAHPGKEIWWMPTGDPFFPSCVILMDGNSVPIAEFMAKEDSAV